MAAQLGGGAAIRHLSTLRRVAAITVPTGLGLLPLNETFRDAVDLWTLCLYTSTISLMVLVLAARSTRRGFWSLSSIYLSVFSLFHFGVIYSFTLVGDSALRSFKLGRWFYSDEVPLAIAAALAGVVSFYACSQIIVARARQPPPHTNSQTDMRAVAGPAGFFIVFMALAWWFALTVRAGGFSLLFASYGDFLLATRNENVSFSYFFVGIGMSLLIASPQRSWARAGFVVFGLWAMIALPLGLRGEVLFPCAGAAALAAKRRPPMSTFKAIALVAISLVLIDLIRQLRQFGIAGAESSLLDLHPTDALLELGGSLLPTVKVIQWLDTGDSFIMGASYWAPFERQLALIIPGMERLPAHEDLRLMNVLVAQRVGPIGFSPVAEAYYNFGGSGVVVVMGLTGFVVGWVESWSASPMRIAAAGAVVFPTLIQIRNSFVPTPSWTAIGLAIVAAIAIADRVRSRSRARRDQP